MLYANTKAGNDITWRKLINSRVERFLSGDWEALWKEARSAEYSAKSSGLTCRQLEELAKERGNHEDIKGAITALRAGHTLLVSKDPSVKAQWREKCDVAGRAATRTWQETAFELNDRDLMDQLNEQQPDRLCPSQKVQTRLCGMRNHRSRR